jgi:hypothetical protein
MIRFLLARLCGDEAYLQGLSRPLPDLAGQTVALVGNARSLSETTFGARIDAADIVVRMNAAPMPSVTSHGVRTDWLATSIPLSAEVIAARAPTRLLWMTAKRRRLPWRIASDPRFYLHPRPDSLALIARLGARATTGALLIDLLARSEAAEVQLYGFDFFASKSLSGRREASQTPHDFDAERVWVEGLLARDARLRLNR